VALAADDHIEGLALDQVELLDIVAELDPQLPIVEADGEPE
jgi:hypothetical protein